MNLKKILTSSLLIGASSLFAVSSQAAMIDFTDSYWSGVEGTSSFSQDGITISTNKNKLTFNSRSSERRGCEASDPYTAVDLACDGDGIGIKNDEITGKKDQVLTITFDTEVDIIEIELLDLFFEEGRWDLPEIAIINAEQFSTGGFIVGGYLATGFTADGITVLTLTAADDRWSDYSIARISTADSVTPVPTTSIPEPASIALFVLGLAAMGMSRRKTK